ncbi:YjbE family putative metal transport protein [Magnetospirillum gryphiswaldense]|uniref:Integral membrane protein TerC n=1 Tax=Magnetospirillum gryphiswaldense TaxID=55518 RepID=A4TWR7_9PROT|nr:YjbE family putative metal transport protein [Magnetospirillum gryphiswaldense]AVM73928.1 Integral membrane protein TerC family protein [Magnetospirillum gryphiswaldense MSR-1]AVM77831.1 Integral membrane protein TerC family protein [Magnetospirillum gryphiswaldense]CAM75074.1 Integral membrane protein TerC [Magnetospirillum gryphiswaldense MSR-1]
MLEFFTLDSLSSLLQVIAIDVALAGDNALVVGMAAAALPLAQRRRAIVIGIAAAAVLRIIFAIFTLQLLKVVGLLLAGGLLLLWVSWKLWREIKMHEAEESEQEAAATGEKSFAAAVTQIVVADVSMSLDNVLAVAGAARDHQMVMIIGLALSVALMGVAANAVAALLKRHHWVAYVGLLIILYVALTMIWDGGQQVLALAQA